MNQGAEEIGDHAAGAVEGAMQLRMGVQVLPRLVHRRLRNDHMSEHLASPFLSIICSINSIWRTLCASIVAIYALCALFQWVYAQRYRLFLIGRLIF